MDLKPTKRLKVFDEAEAQLPENPIQPAAVPGAASNSNNPLATSSCSVGEVGITASRRKVVQIKDLLHSILVKIIVYTNGDTFYGRLPAVARVNKHFYNVYLQAIRQLDLSNKKHLLGSTLIIHCLQRDSKRFPNLQSLNLTWCDRDHTSHITDAVLEHLKGLSALQSLNLSRCRRITDAGLEHLKGLSALQSLNLPWGDQITDAGLVHLKGLSALQSLDLGHCKQITNAGLEHLKGLSALQSLNLRYTKVRDIERAHRILQLPKLKIK